jgi:hypothetical protein
MSILFEHFICLIYDLISREKKKNQIYNGKESNANA